MREWAGPVSAAVYIEYKADAAEARACENKVTDYMEKIVSELWPRAEAAPAISISFLYAKFDLPDANCNFRDPNEVATGPNSHAQGTQRASPENNFKEKEQGQEPSAQLQQQGDGSRSGPSSFGMRAAKPWGSPSIPRRLYNRFQRHLRDSDDVDDDVDLGWPQETSSPQGATGTHNITQPEEPIIKPVWHFHPNAKGATKLLVSERPWREVYDEFYPVNALRNLAWEQVWHVLLVSTCYSVVVIQNCMLRVHLLFIAQLVGRGPSWCGMCQGPMVALHDECASTHGLAGSPPC
jgi:hypothetical protein